MSASVSAAILSGVSPLTPSTSQRHLANVLTTLLASRTASTPIRVLEMGCGDAHMLAYFAQQMRARLPGPRFEWYGFDVDDIGWQGEMYRKQTVEFLSDHVPETNWRDRITTFSASSTWSYPAASFDVIVSNQVLEHVRDHHLVFSEIRRCLSPNGISIHLFPLRETVYEVHAHMPVVHWIRDAKRRSRVMSLFARLGFRRKYREEAYFRGWTNLDEFGAIYSEVLETMTNYKTSKQMLLLARAAGLRADYSYTKDFLRTKLLALRGRARNDCAPPGQLDPAWFWFLKRLASVTLVLRPGSAPGA